jgi:hypothetical protein
LQLFYGFPLYNVNSAGGEVENNEEKELVELAKKQVAIDDVLKNAHNVNWHFSSPDGDTIDVSIKDVEFN